MIIQRRKYLLGLLHEFVLSFFLASMVLASIVCRISAATAFANSTKADVGSKAYRIFDVIESIYI